MPVWQAVRPFSRALSVHQGKGSTPADAQVGALLEALESDAAERFSAEGPICRFDALPRDERAPHLADFARADGRGPDPEIAHRWVEVADIGSGRRLHLPFDLVSLDLTTNLSSPFQRTSDGNAAGLSREEAIDVALHETIERDALAEWLAGGIIDRTRSRVPLATIGMDWFGFWRDRLEAEGVSLSVFSVPSITETPVLVCELFEEERHELAYRGTWGSGAHCDPGVALFRALAEAVQSRLTAISGARDDLSWSKYAEPAVSVRGFALPPVRQLPGRDWDSITPGPATPTAIVAALASRGYDRIAVAEIDRRCGFHLLKAFVCGLGSAPRRRRRQ